MRGTRFKIEYHDYFNPHDRRAFEVMALSRTRARVEAGRRLSANVQVAGVIDTVLPVEKRHDGKGKQPV